jgi:hypothetical protein
VTLEEKLSVVADYRNFWLNEAHMSSVVLLREGGMKTTFDGSACLQALLCSISQQSLVFTGL